MHYAAQCHYTNLRFEHLLYFLTNPMPRATRTYCIKTSKYGTPRATRGVPAGTCTGTFTPTASLGAIPYCVRLHISTSHHLKYPALWYLLYD
jgi:hypothetical protein